MPGVRNVALTVKALDALKGREKPYRVVAGKGLLVVVKPSGAKTWIARIVIDGRRRDMGLGGGYPDISLKDAQERADAARKAARAGDDPIRTARAVKEEKRNQRAVEDVASARTFRHVAERCIKAETPGWKSPRTAQQWGSALERHIYPKIGDTPVAEIDRAAVRDAIGDVWVSAPAVAKKTLQYVAVILRFAAAHGWRANDNPADPKMLRYAGLAPLRGKQKQPSLPWIKVPAFFTALKKVEGASALALRFLGLTALRSGEVRQARWSWLSFDSATPVLTIPGEVMKGRKTADRVAHRVPLAPAALDVLALAYADATGAAAKLEKLPALAALRGDALIFQGRKRNVPLSDMSLSAVMRRMNADRPKGVPAPWKDPDGREAVPHGLRSSFSTWVDDTRPHEREAAERALAHQIANSASAAYRRSDMLDRRISLMGAWASHCLGVDSEEAGQGRSAGR